MEQCNESPSRPNIVMIDDEAINLKILSTILNDLNYRIRVFRNPKSALSSIECDLPNIILLDIVMPEMDGFEVCHILKQNDKTKDIPVIFISALKQVSDIVNAFSVGGVDYISKPFQAEEIIARVKTHLTITLMREELKSHNQNLQHEIQQRKRVEQELKNYQNVLEDIVKLRTNDLEKSNQYLENIIKSTPNSLIVLDKNCNIFLCNQGTVTLTGYDESELVGKSYCMIVNKDNKNAPCPIIQKLMAEKFIQNHEMVYYSKDNQDIPIHFSGAVITDNNESIESIICIAQDIRELKETTAQLIQSAKLSGLGELAAGITHELKQPLFVMKIIAQSLLKDLSHNRLNECDLKTNFNDIVNQINKMSELIDHVRMFSRRSEGQHFEILSINDILNETLKFFRKQLSNQQIDIKKDFMDNISRIKGDAIRVEQVFINMLTNALGALENCQNNEKIIEIKTFAEDDYVVVEIHDNGSGIPDAMQEKIFHPFFTTKDREKGTGLGLSISKRIIEEHKGQIHLSSIVNQGTCFKIMWPAFNNDEETKA